MSRSKALSLERTLAVASALLVERQGQNMSISEIAELAHCSTSTIYDVFRSKEQLFLEAFAYGQSQRQPPAVIIPENDVDSFDALLDYLQRRVAFVSKKRCRGSFIALLLHGQSSSAAGDFVDEKSDELGRLAIVVEGAMRSGHLKAADPSIVAYCLSSTASYEPLIANIVRGDTVCAGDVLDQALTPFVSDEGQAILAAVLAALQKEQPPEQGDEQPPVRSWLRRSPAKEK